MAHFPKPFFKRSRGLWYVEIDRRQVNLGVERDEAFRRYHELMGQSRLRPVAGLLLVEVIDRFLEWVKRERAPDTYEWYRYRLQRLSERHPQLKLVDLRPFTIQEWVDEYPALSKTSRRNYVRSIKACLAWALKQGYIEKNPIAHLAVPGAERRETVVTLGEYERLLTLIPDPTFRELVIATWETGCRPQESLRLEARHVDLDKRRWVFPRAEAKGKKAPRVVYLSDTALEITRRLMEANPNGRLFRNSAGKPWTTDAVNCAFDRLQVRLGKAELQRSGTTIDATAVADLIPKLVKTRRRKDVTIAKTEAELREEARRKLTNRQAAMLVPRYSLYALRHSWATRALQSGLDGLTVAILMGHSDPSTLARVYQHLSHNPEHLQSQLARVGKGEGVRG